MNQIVFQPICTLVVAMLVVPLSQYGADACTFPVGVPWMRIEELITTGNEWKGATPCCGCINY